MSLREFRASWRRLLFFFLCVAIGVGAIVALRSVIQSLRLGLVSEARSMIASDVIVQTNRAWTPEVRRRVDEILASAPVLAETESIETPTMVRAEQGIAVARMVELRAVEAAFPFYGTLALADGQRLLPRAPAPTAARLSARSSWFSSACRSGIGCSSAASRSPSAA